MKITDKVIAFSIILGLFLWVIDAVLDWTIFYQRAFFEMLITDVPKHEVYIRSVILLSCFMFGLIISRIMARRKRADEDLRNAHGELKLEMEERNLAEEALRGSEKRYRLLTENVADGIGIVQDGKFVFVNEALASIFASAEDQLIGTDPTKLIHDDHKERFRELIEPLEKGVPMESFQAPCFRRDGQEIWIEGRRNVIEWEGEPGLLVTLRDITENKLQEITIEKERERLKSENTKLRSALKNRSGFGDIIGNSPSMQEVYERIMQAATSDANVVIYGESGTGKDLIARTIHEMSGRGEGAFVPVNCGAIPESLFESEFFGYKKGAFTGADKDKAGFFDFAHKGTLFLDEVGELPLNMQVKLLRAIEAGGYTPVGDNRSRKTDVRIITATHGNLPDMVRRGLMREDFFYRIYILPIKVPPLRERKEDIPALVEHFLQSHGIGKKALTIPKKILEALCKYEWPGNVREVQNVLHRYLAVGKLDFMEHSPHQSAERDDVLDKESHEKNTELRLALNNFEKGFIVQALNKTNWNKGKASSVLGVPRRTLFTKMKSFGLV